MTRKRHHQSTARPSTRQATSIEKLAKSLGHEPTTGSWRSDILNGHKKPSKFIGRAIIGSEIIVDEMKVRFPGVNFVTSNGQLTLTLMHRRALANHPEASKILEDVERRIAHRYPDTMECLVNPYAIRQQSVSHEWTARIPLTGINGDIHNELNSTCRLLEQAGITPLLQPASVRIAETASRRELEYVAHETFSMLGETVLLAQPAILNADERKS